MARRARGTIVWRADRGCYIARARDAQGRHRSRQGGSTVASARRALDELLDEIDAHADGALTLAEYLEQGYLQDLASRLADPGTAQAQLLAAAGELLVAMRDVDEAAAARYLQGLRDGRTVATVRRHRSALSTCWKAAKRDGVVRHNPWLEVALPAERADTAGRFLTEAQLRAIYRAIGPRYRPWGTGLGETAMGEGDARALTWQQVEPGDAHVTFSRRKTGRVVRLPLRPLAVEVLAEMRARRIHTLRESDRVFRGIGTRSGAFRIAWQERIRDPETGLGHEGLRVYDLRHARASLLAAAGVPLGHVARWLGHSTPRLALERYARHAPEDALDRALELSLRAERSTRPGDPPAAASDRTA